MAERPGGALVVRDLAVVYGGAIHALRGVSLEVPAGGALAVLGANGAGKTSLLRAVTGLLGFHDGRVIRGEVTLDGRSVAGRPPHDLVRAGIAQVMEGRRIFAPLTVADNLRAGGLAQRGGAEDGARDHVLRLFPVLGERLRQPAGLLSGGEQQMLAIGRALMARPRLLVLDEPSLGLAPKLVGQIRDAISAINADGTSVLLVEQNAHMALQIADHAVVLVNGRVGASDRADRLADGKALRSAYLGRARA